jgi:hypothetical protein
MSCRLEERNEDQENRKTYLENKVKETIPTGSEVEMEKAPDWSSSSDSLVAEFRLKVPGWASAAGRHAVVPVGLFTELDRHLFEHAERAHPVYFAYPYQALDDLTIDLPLGWKVSSLPNAEKVDVKFTAFESSVVNDRGTLYLKRTLSVNGILLDKKYYGTLRGLFQRVRAGDEQQIMVQPGGPGSGE